MNRFEEIRYSLAPMEGITGYIFRNAFNDHFGDDIDRYYTPFLVVHEKRAMSSKESNEILPENNRGLNLIPQILADDADGFLRIDRALYEYGYREVNLNLGCPSKTVASKGRGSGFLARKLQLDDFLYEIFEGRSCDISIKTRIGTKDPGEFEELLSIYNKYPVKELIIHPRVRYEYYGGKPHRDEFFKAARESVNPVCYNGDVTSSSDIEELLNGYTPKTGTPYSVMIGRGLLSDPSLVRQLKGGTPYTKEELQAFLTRLREDYSEVLQGQTQILQKMKEIWSYLGRDLRFSQPVLKQLLKCRSLSEYRMAEHQLLNNMEMHDEET